MPANEQLHACSELPAAPWDFNNAGAVLWKSCGVPQHYYCCYRPSTHAATILTQGGFLELGPSSLRVTKAYYQKYEKIDKMLRDKPGILDAFHRDASKALSKRVLRRRRSCFSSEHFLRAILVMEIERLSYRDAVIRIDDSVFLRRFIGIPFGSIMDFTLLCKVFKSIRAATWKRINTRLSDYAVEREWIDGTLLRVDTTAVETNVHYPTDSSLLWDSYRVMGRLIGAIRSYAPEAVGGYRLQMRLVKRTALLIARRANHKSHKRPILQKPFKLLLEHVSWIATWSDEIQEACRRGITEGRYDLDTVRILEGLLSELEQIAALSSRVIDQTQRRVFQGESVPVGEKLFSLFEPHTELLIRGKAGKPVEFGHMILLNQVENKFISNYQVFEKRPSDESLMDSILSSHKKQFGHLPKNLAADKGFYKSMEKIAELESRIDNVSLAKKGSRTAAETEREHSLVFRNLQRFRAGIEGSISFLKRCLKMGRCLYRSFKTYCSSIGCHIFTHNLLVLTRL